MLRLAIEGIPGFHIDTREVERPGPSYMVDTLESMRSEFPRASLALLIGQDAANSLDSWHRWRELLELAHLVIMSRHGDIADYPADVEEAISGGRVHDPEVLRLKPAGYVLELTIDSLPISSSSIRDLICTDRSPRFLLPECVLEFIMKHRLYAG